MPWLHDALSGLLYLLAPRRCPACELALEEEAEIFCPACRPLLEPLRSGPAAFAYGGPMAEAIQRLKYGRRSELGQPLGSLLIPKAQALSCSIDALVPIPLHPRRRSQRGFDQARLLCVPLRRALDLPLRHRWLRRVKPTMPQARLERGARQQNLRGAFVASGRVRERRILLIDDVHTTGATLRAGAEALRDAGASEVIPLALAGAARPWSGGPEPEAGEELAQSPEDGPASNSTRAASIQSASRS